MSDGRRLGRFVGTSRALIVLVGLFVLSVVPWLAEADPLLDAVDAVNETTDVLGGHGTFTATAVIDVQPDNQFRLTLNDVTIRVTGAPEIWPSLEPELNYLGPYTIRFTGLGRDSYAPGVCVAVPTAKLPCGALRSGFVDCHWRLCDVPPVPATVSAPHHPLETLPGATSTYCGAAGRNSHWRASWEQFVSWQVAVSCSYEWGALGYTLYQACPVVVDKIVDRARVTLRLAGPLSSDCV